MKHAHYALVLSEPMSLLHCASERDIETFGAVAPVAEVPSPVLDSANAVVGSFLDLLLLRFPHSSLEFWHRQADMMASFPRCIPAPLSLAQRNRDAAERPTLTEPAVSGTWSLSQSDVDSLHPG